MSGAGRSTAPDHLGRELYDRGTHTLGQLLCAWPGAGSKGQAAGDDLAPLPNIAAFDRLVENDYLPQQVENLVNWVEPHTTIEYLLKFHGPDGCRRVINGIAKAAVKLEVAMKPRTKQASIALGLLDPEL